MIKKILLIPLLFFVTLSASAQDAEEKQKQFSVNSVLTVVNNYYWRGDYFYPEGIPAFQPEVTLTYEKVPLSLNIWSSIPLSRRAEIADARDELDFQLSGDINISESLALTLGLELYTYPFSPTFSYTNELYAILYYELLYGFGLEFDSYVDVNDLKGIYLAFLPFYETSLREGLDLKLQMLLGYTNYSSFGPKFAELGFKTTLSWQFSDYVALNTSILYNYNYSVSKHLYAATMGLALGI